MYGIDVALYTCRMECNIALSLTILKQKGNLQVHVIILIVMYVMRCMQTEIYIVMVFVGGDAPPKSSAEATRLTRTQQKGE